MSVSYWELAIRVAFLQLAGLQAESTSGLTVLVIQDGSLESHASMAAELQSFIDKFGNAKL